VGLDRVLLDDQFLGDLDVGQAARDQPEHLLFPRGELAQLRRQLGRPAGGEGEPGDEPAGDDGIDEGVARGQTAHRGHQLVRRGVLEQETAGPGTEGFVNVLVGVERGEDQHPGTGAEGQHFPGRLQAVQHRHPDVEQRDRRPVPAYQLDGLRPVPGLGHHRDARLGVEDHPQAAADHPLIVGDDHGDRGAVGAVGGQPGTVRLGHRLSPRSLRSRVTAKRSPQE
jgi:hypothetical protein